MISSKSSEKFSNVINVFIWNRLALLLLLYNDVFQLLKVRPITQLLRISPLKLPLVITGNVSVCLLATVVEFVVLQKEYTDVNKLHIKIIKFEL